MNRDFGETQNISEVYALLRYNSEIEGDSNKMGDFQITKKTSEFEDTFDELLLSNKMQQTDDEMK